VAAGVGAPEVGAPRYGDLRRITTSITISALGTWSYNVGIAVYAYQQTHSTTWVALATVGRYVPALLLTWYGSRWVDGQPRRRVAVSADVLCAAAMLALTAVASTDGPLLLAIGLAALSSGAARIQSSAAISLAADLAAESQLMRSTVLISTAETVAIAAGPAIASAVLSVSSTAWLFGLNGLTFACSALLLAGVRPLSPRATLAADGTDGEDPAYRAAVRVVWPLLATRTLAAFIYGLDVVLLAVLATQQLGQGANGYGWLLAAAGAGGLLSAAFLHRRQGPRRSGPLSLLGLALYSLPLLVFEATPGLPLSLGTQVVRGLGCVLVTCTVVVGLQRAVPSRPAGRIFGLASALVLAGTCSGALCAALLLHVIGLRATLVVGALVPFLAQLALLPALVRFDRGGAQALAALDPVVDVLRGLTLFKDASRATLYGVADHASELSAAPGDTLVHEGGSSDALYVLLSGSVEVTTGQQPARVRLRVMTGPAYFGEIGLIHGVPRTATVTATEPSTLLRIPADTFLTAAAAAGLSSALTETVRYRLAPAPVADGRASDAEA
jgi:MFS family permease